MGRFGSAVINRAAVNGSPAFFTHTLRVSLYGLMNAMYLPSGESWAPVISGLPKNSSRSSSGGCEAAARPARGAATGAGTCVEAVVADTATMARPSAMVRAR